MKSFVAAILAGAAIALPLPAQQHAPDSDLRRLRSDLRTHALSLLERFGDTFYALGAFIDSTGTLEEFTPERWPVLSAPPREWEDSLVAAALQSRRRPRAIAILIDLGRSTDEPRTSKAGAVFHGETRGGTCQEEAEPFNWLDNGRVTWGPPKTFPCRRRLFAQ